MFRHLYHDIKNVESTLPGLMGTSMFEVMRPIINFHPSGLFTTYVLRWEATTTRLETNAIVKLMSFRKKSSTEDYYMRLLKAAKEHYTPVRARIMSPDNIVSYFSYVVIIAEADVIMDMMNTEHPLFPNRPWEREEVLEFLRDVLPYFGHEFVADRPPREGNRPRLLISWTRTPPSSDLIQNAVPMDQVWTHLGLPRGEIDPSILPQMRSYESRQRQLQLMREQIQLMRQYLGPQDVRPQNDQSRADPN